MRSEFIIRRSESRRGGRLSLRPISEELFLTNKKKALLKDCNIWETWITCIIGGILMQRQWVRGWG